MASEHFAEWTLDPDFVFLNHGSFGATPRSVLARQDELRARIESQPVRFFMREVEPLMTEARARAAAFVGCAPERFTFVPNTTTGINVFFASIELAAGDEVVVTRLEYNATKNIAEVYAKRAGATVRYVTIPLPLSDPTEIVDAIGRELGPKTRIVMFDHVTSQTALVLPAAEIVERVRETCDALVIVDGAHAPGMIELDVEALGADFYAGNFHKWVCSPKGSAFLWASEAHRDTLEPLVVSHGANMTFDDPADRFHFRFDWQGTADMTPWLCVPAAIDAMEQMVGSWDEVRRRNRALALEAREMLNDVLGAPKLCPDSMIGSIAAMILPDPETPRLTPFSPDPLQERLFHEHRIEVPVLPQQTDPKRLLRISAQLYNDRTDYEALAAVL